MKRRNSHFSGGHPRPASTAALLNLPLSIESNNNPHLHRTVQSASVDSPKVRRIHHGTSVFTSVFQQSKKSCWTMIPFRNPAVLTTRSDSFRVESSRRSKMKRVSWWRTSQLAPRIFAAMFLCRFSWDLYMIHNVSWPQDVLQPSGLDVHRRFLEQFRKSHDDVVPGQHFHEPSMNARLQRPPPFSLPPSMMHKEVDLLSLDGLFGLGSPATTIEEVEKAHSWWNKSGRYDWKNRCKAAGLNETSKVFISDIVRQPAASLTALFLANQCNVKQILGSDPLFPNIRAARIRYMQVYRKLLQQIPEFRLVLTEIGLRSSVDRKAPKWLFDFEPSHLIISQHASLEHDIDYVMKRQNYQLFQEKHQFAVWRDIWLNLEGRRRDVGEPRILHLEGTALSPFDGPHTKADTYFPLLTAHQFTRNFVQVKLPEIYGPGYGLLTSADDPFQKSFDDHRNTPNTSQRLYVDDALAAILTGLETKPAFQKGTIRSIDASQLLASTSISNVDFEKDFSQRMRRAQAWQEYLQYPFGPSRNQYNAQNETLEGAGTSLLSQHEIVIAGPTKMPCASQCTPENFRCESSAFDDVVERSRQHTKACQYIIYFGNFSDSLQLPKTQENPSLKGLCRLAFVSSTSKLVQSLWHKNEEQSKTPLASLNGKLVHNRWRLFWPSRKYGDFTTGDASLLRIDPSRLFSPNVRKALFLSSSFESYMKISDQQAMNMFVNADSPAYKSGARAYKEHRSGTHLNRWVHLPETKARNSVLMGGSGFSKNIGDVTPSMVVRNRSHSKKQIAFYQQMSHWVHTNQGRPQFEVGSSK